MSNLKYVIVWLLLLFAIYAKAQPTQECGTKAPLVKPVLSLEKINKTLERRMRFESPYPLKIFIRVFEDDDNTDLAATETDVMRQVENMRQFFSPHNICFIHVGYEIIRNTDLNNMSVDEGDDVNQLSSLAINSCITIFIHNSLSDSKGSLNGNAYGIPNHFISVVGSAIQSTTNLSTMAHEMGHALGLLHTFEDTYGEEAVARSGDCKDCEDEGDLLCDTQADLNNASDDISESCNYIGSATDECGDQYLFEITNIMSYGRRSCRDHFTSGQGIRALTYTLNDHSSRIAENAQFVLYENLSTGLRTFAARNSITFSPTGYEVSSGGRANFTSSSIVFSPGVEFKPTTGYVVARSTVYCQ